MHDMAIDAVRGSLNYRDEHNAHNPRVALRPYFSSVQADTLLCCDCTVVEDRKHDDDDLRAPRGIVLGVLLSLMLWALLVLGIATLAHATPLPPCPALVQQVHDGDTLTVLCGAQRVHVRLAGIDAPELTQPYGHAAQQRVVTLVLGRTVTLGAGYLDRYGRRIATVTTADGRSMGLVLVEEGLAWWYVSFAPHATDLRDAEQAARAMHLGLWQDAMPIAPWAWRKGVR